MMHRWQRYRCRRRNTADAQVHLLIYERRDEFGHGPAMSVYRGETEVLRFDFFDPPHVHRRSEPGQPRCFYPAGNRLEQNVELAIRELVSKFPRLSFADLRWIRSELCPSSLSLATGKPTPKE